MPDKESGYRPEILEKDRSMTEAETISFLQENGVLRLAMSDWKAHQPVLYVFEEMYRGDEGPFKHLPSDKRPSIARVDDPVALDLSNPKTDNYFPGRVVFDLNNEGGRVDLFAIDPQTKLPVLIGTELKTKSYQVRPENFFSDADELFSKRG